MTQPAWVPPRSWWRLISVLTFWRCHWKLVWDNLKLPSSSLFPIQKSFLNPFMFHVFEFTLNNSFTQLKIQAERKRQEKKYWVCPSMPISLKSFFLMNFLRISQTIGRSLQTQRDRMQCIGQCKCCLYRTTTDRERKRIESLDAVFGKSL